MTEDRADMVLVPRVPTEAMFDAGFEVYPAYVEEHWTAMIDASPIPVAGKDEIERLRALVEEACTLGDDYYEHLAGTSYAEDHIKPRVAAIRAALHHPNVGDKMGEDK